MNEKAQSDWDCAFFGAIFDAGIRKKLGIRSGLPVNCCSYTVGAL